MQAAAAVAARTASVDDDGGTRVVAVEEDAEDVVECALLAIAEATLATACAENTVIGSGIDDGGRVRENSQDRGGGGRKGEGEREI